MLSNCQRSLIGLLLALVVRAFSLLLSHSSATQCTESIESIVLTLSFSLSIYLSTLRSFSFDSITQAMTPDLTVALAVAIAATDDNDNDDSDNDNELSQPYLWALSKKQIINESGALCQFRHNRQLTKQRYTHKR